MVVSCPSCDRKYKFSEDKLGKRGAKITCPKCRHVFVVHKDRDIESLGRKAEDGTIEADPRVGSPAAERTPWPRDFPTWSFRELGAAWQVRKQGGMTYGFESLDELQGFLDERQVSRDDEISVDGREWVAISDFADLTAYFYDVWKRIESGDIVVGGAGEEEEDDADAPTTIMGAGTSLADEIRRAVQDTMTPSPAVDRVRATPRPPTPRGASSRALTPGGEGTGGGFMAPPPASDAGPSWGGPALSLDDPKNEDETIGRFMTRVSSEVGSTAPTYGGRTAPTPPSQPRLRQPAFGADPVPVAPKPLGDPFAALGGGGAAPADPAPKAQPAQVPGAAAPSGDTDPVEVVLAILAGLSFVFVLYVTGIKSGVVPLTLVPFEVPRLLLPDAPEALAPAPVDPAAAPGGEEEAVPAAAGAEAEEVVGSEPSADGEAAEVEPAPSGDALAVPPSPEEARSGEAMTAPPEAGE